MQCMYWLYSKRCGIKICDILTKLFNFLSCHELQNTPGRIYFSQLYTIISISLNASISLTIRELLATYLGHILKVAALKSIAY